VIEMFLLLASFETGGIKLTVAYIEVRASGSPCGSSPKTKKGGRPSKLRKSP
jgi:hypothetical protein